MDSKVDDWARKGGLGLGFRGYNTPMPQGICRLENGVILTFFHGLFQELVMANSRSMVSFGILAIRFC